MYNLTLDVFWITFMPIYQHSIGAVTILLSALVIYLMVSKTPEQGRPLARYLILLQLSILFVDLIWGFIVCPIFLCPVTAMLCSGFLCGTETGRHIAIVLQVQCVVQVAMTVTLALHYKYTTVLLMTNRRSVSHQYFLADLIEINGNLHGIAYSIPDNLAIPLGLLFGVPMVVTVAGSNFFVSRTLHMLSAKTSSMSERTRKMQQSLMRMLLMQLGIPLVIQIVPITFVGISVATFWFTPGWINFALCIQLCHAILHTIFLIITTPSYRTAFARFGSIRRKITFASVTSGVSTK